MGFTMLQTIFNLVLSEASMPAADDIYILREHEKYISLSLLAVTPPSTSTMQAFTKAM